MQKQYKDTDLVARNRDIPQGIPLKVIQNNKPINRELFIYKLLSDYSGASSQEQIKKQAH